MRLAVIGTFYGRFENSFPLLHRLYVDGTRTPDEAWLIGETEEDARHLVSALDELYDLELVEGWPDGLFIEQVETPRNGPGYSVIPYSHKINWALDRTEADVIVYLDNGSMPFPEKYGQMLEALEQHPEWGAVYCGQRRDGQSGRLDVPAGDVVEDAYCALNFTQVMHRRTEDRWPLDMRWADPDLADAIFWRHLHQSLGAFHPVPGILDYHYIFGAKAQGL